MRIIIAFVMLFFVSCSHTCYVVRHAEKESSTAAMTSDVPLSIAGQLRAEAIRNLLASKKIGAVYSTNTIRTRSTAQPTADYFKLPIQPYDPRPDAVFLKTIKSLRHNVLIVGHSNTVDDIVNGLCGEQKVAGDLADGEYNTLFIIRFKGKKATLKENMIYPE